MTLSVDVLRLDRFAPFADDVQEVALEPRHPAADVGELVPRAKEGEADVRPVERLQRLAIAAQTSIQLGELAAGVALEREVARPRAHGARSLEMQFGVGQIARLAGNDAVHLLRLAVG